MKGKEIASIVLFGSVWGMLECILGDLLRSWDLPAGAILTGTVAVSLMTYTRMIFRKRGMQFGMSLVAGALRLTNPFTGCLLCSAIAIIAEGAIFEAVWYRITDPRSVGKPVAIMGLGLITSYLCYIGGYTVTQVLTPLLFSSLHTEDILLLPVYTLAKGLPAGLLGSVFVLLTSSARRLDISRVKSRIYYPATLALSALCWIVGMMG